MRIAKTPSSLVNPVNACSQSGPDNDRLYQPLSSRWNKVNAKHRPGSEDLSGTLGLASMLATTAAAIALLSPIMIAPTAANAQELESFAILAGQSITNIGDTVIIGNIGVYPGNTYTGDGSVTQTGTTHLGDALAARMQDDLTTLYNVLAGRPTSDGGNLTGQNLNGETLLPGVYNFDTSMLLGVGETLTLDAGGDPNAIFIFNIGSTMTIGSNATIQIINGDPNSGGNVFYRVGSSATLGTDSEIVGQIVALSDISMLSDASIDCGAALARNGSVTLIANYIAICELTAASFVDAVGDGDTTPTDNEQAVADALDTFVAGGGVLPLGFAILAATLTPAELAAALAQLSGETATAVAPTGMQAMDSFLDTVLGGRGGPGMSMAPPPSTPPHIPSTVSVLGYGPQPAEAHPDRFASHETMPLRRAWDMWMAVHGGYGVVDGNSVIGSHQRTSRDLGIALGVDFHPDPDTMIGIAAGTGGTRFDLDDGFGSGRSRTFHVAVHGRKQFDAAYFVGALAYGYSDVTTNRTVTIAGTDRFEANFGAHNVAGHIEGGYRMGWLTPYAAVRGQAFMTPAYSERTVSGVSTFALDYAARTATSLRTELGTHAEWTTEFDDDTVLALRLRGAWVHEFGSNTAVNASFQSMPGSEFTVTGATADRNSLLVSAGAEIRMGEGLYVAGSINGRFARNARAYGGAVKMGYTF